MNITQMLSYDLLAWEFLRKEGFYLLYTQSKYYLEITLTFGFSAAGK